MWSFWVVFRSTGSLPFINRCAMRYLTHKTARAVTATRPNTPTAATPPIKAVCLPWPESVDIKQVNTFQKSKQTGFRCILKQRGQRGLQRNGFFNKGSVMPVNGSHIYLERRASLDFFQREKSKISFVSVYREYTVV